MSPDARLATALATGTTTIKAINGKISGSTPLTVGASLQSITLLPLNPSIVTGHRPAIHRHRATTAMAPRRTLLTQSLDFFHHQHRHDHQHRISHQHCHRNNHHQRRLRKRQRFGYAHRKSRGPALDRRDSRQCHRRSRHHAAIRRRRHLQRRQHPRPHHHHRLEFHRNRHRHHQQ